MNAATVEEPTATAISAWLHQEALPSPDAAPDQGTPPADAAPDDAAQDQEKKRKKIKYPCLLVPLPIAMTVMTCPLKDDEHERGEFCHRFETKEIKRKNQHMEHHRKNPGPEKKRWCQCRYTGVVYTRKSNLTAAQKRYFAKRAKLRKLKLTPIGMDYSV
jgi:hypothetical protein